MRVGGVQIAVALVAGALAMSACADDGPDRLAEQERIERLAEVARAVTTTSAPADDARAQVTTATVATTSPVPTAESVASTTPVEPTGVVVPVAALDNIFRPEVVTIRAGDEVLWENRGINDHNVLSVEGDDWGVEVEGFVPGAVYSHVFTTPGEYRYFCSIHGNETIGMIGTIIVEG